jgi:hypothetical protein
MKNELVRQLSRDAVRVCARDWTCDRAAEKPRSFPGRPIWTEISRPCSRPSRAHSAVPVKTPPPTVRIPSSARHLPTVVLGRCKRSRFLSAAAPTLAHVVYNWPITGEKHIPVNRYIATTSTSWPFFSTLPPILPSSPPSAFPGPPSQCSVPIPRIYWLFLFLLSCVH